MFIRCAFFRKELVPLWTRFPGAQEVRVLRQIESDVNDPRLEMVLSVRYPSRESIDIALASEVRLKSREVSVALIDMFDGTVFHTIFSADEYGLPTD